MINQTISVQKTESGETIVLVNSEPVKTLSKMQMLEDSRLYRTVEGLFLAFHYYDHQQHRRVYGREKLA